MANKDVKECFVKIGDFDASRLRLKDPITNTFKKGKSVVEWTTSEGRYVDDNGEECELYLEFPEQYCYFGINAVYPIGTADEDKTPEKIEGLQICYPLTSLKTIETPTKEEKYALGVCDSLWDTAWKSMEKECAKKPKERRVPSPSYNSWLAARESKDPKEAVKPIYSFPLKKNEKTGKKDSVDTSKPQQMYSKLLTSGKGRKLSCITAIYGPGDKRDKTGMKFLDARGRIRPVFKWDGVFWGSHGQKASYGASVRLKVAEMNFVPQTGGGPKHRMLGANTAPVENDDSDEDGAFDNPTEENGKNNKKELKSDDNNPAKILNENGANGGSSSQSEEEEEENNHNPSGSQSEDEEITYTEKKPNPKNSHREELLRKKRAAIAARKKKETE